MNLLPYVADSWMVNNARPFPLKLELRNIEINSESSGPLDRIVTVVETSTMTLSLGTMLSSSEATHEV